MSQKIIRQIQHFPNSVSPYTTFSLSPYLSTIIVFLLISISHSAQSDFIWGNLPAIQDMQSGSIIVGTDPGVFTASLTYTVNFVGSISNPQIILCINDWKFESGTALFAKFNVKHSSLTTTSCNIDITSVLDIIIHLSTVQYIAFDQLASLCQDTLGITTQYYQISTTNQINANQGEDITISLTTPYISPTDIQTDPSNTQIKCLNFLLGFDITSVETDNRYIFQTKCKEVVYDDTNAIVNAKIGTNNYAETIYGNIMLFLHREGLYFTYFYDAILVYGSDLSTIYSQTEYQLLYLHSHQYKLKDSKGVWLWGMSSIQVMKSSAQYALTIDLHNSEYTITVGGTGVNVIDPTSVHKSLANFFYFSIVQCPPGNFYNRITSLCQDLSTSCPSDPLIKLIDTNTIDSWTIQTQLNPANQPSLYFPKDQLHIFSSVPTKSNEDIQIISLSTSLSMNAKQSLSNNQNDQYMVSLSETDFMLIGNSLYQLEFPQTNPTESLSPVFQIVPPPQANPYHYIKGALVKKTGKNHIQFVLLDSLGSIQIYSALLTDSNVEPILNYQGLITDIQNSVGTLNASPTPAEVLTNHIQLISLSAIFSNQNTFQFQIVLRTNILIYQFTRNSQSLTLKYYQELPYPTMAYIQANNPIVQSIPLRKQDTSSDPNTITVNCLKKQYIFDRLLYIYIIKSDGNFLIYRSINPSLIDFESYSNSFNFNYILIQQELDINDKNILYTEKLTTFIKKSSLDIDSSADGNVVAISTDSNLVYILGVQYLSVNDCILQSIDNNLCIGNATDPQTIISTYFPEISGASSLYKYEILELRNLADQLGGQAIQRIAVSNGEYHLGFMTSSVKTYSFTCYLNQPNPRSSCKHSISQQYEVVKQQEKKQQENVQQQVNPTPTPTPNPTPTPTPSPTQQQNIEQQQNTEPDPHPQNNQEIQTNQSVQEQNNGQLLSQTAIIIFSTLGGVTVIATPIAVYNICIKNTSNNIKVNPENITRGSMYNTKGNTNGKMQSQSLAEFTNSNIENHSTRLNTDIKIEHTYERGLIQQKSRKIMIIEDIE